MGAVAVFVLFAITDASSDHLWLKQTGLAAWTQQAAFFGILAVPVGLLMIAGEFDLSTGVMSGATAIVMALLVGKYHWNAWLAIIGTLVFATAVGLLNGVVVVQDEAAQLHRHAGDILRAPGRQRRRGAAAQPRQHSGRREQRFTPPGSSSAKKIFGSSFFSSGTLPSGYSTAILWFIAVTVSRHLGAQPDDVRQLDLRGRGRRERRAQRRRPGRRGRRSLLFLSTALAAALVGIISFTAGVLGGFRAGRRLRVLLHHRRRRRRLPA